MKIRKAGEVHKAVEVHKAAEVRKAAVPEAEILQRRRLLLRIPADRIREVHPRLPAMIRLREAVLSAVRRV